MKRFICSLSVTIVLFFFTTGVAANLNDLVILTENYPPYNFVEGEQLKGLSVDIVIETMKLIDPNFDRKDIHVVPWARAYDQLQNSKNTIVFSVAHSNDRDNDFKWVGPIGHLTIGVIAQKRDKVVIKEPADFEKYRIGVVREDIGHQLMRQLIPEKDLDIVNSSDSNLRKLKERRIDLFIYDINVAWDVLRRLGMDPEKYEVVYVLEKMPLCMALNRNAAPSLVEELQRALDMVLDIQ